MEACNGKTGVVAVMLAGHLPVHLSRGSRIFTIWTGQNQPGIAEGPRLPGDALYSEQGAGSSSAVFSGTSISEFHLTEDLIPPLLCLTVDDWFSRQSEN